MVLIDGGDPAYVNVALAAERLPHFRAFMNDGFVSVALGAMPSFTNPNNVSVITGVPPSVHGISGNFFLNPATGQETMMDQPEFLRADSILAKFSEHGARVVAVTAKNKLAKILADKLQKGISFPLSAPDMCTREKNGIGDCLAYVGKASPQRVFPDLSILPYRGRREDPRAGKARPDVLSLSDYIQHKYSAQDRKRRAISMSRLTATWGALPRWSSGGDGRPRNERQVDSRRFS